VVLPAYRMAVLSPLPDVSAGRQIKSASVCLSAREILKAQRRTRNAVNVWAAAEQAIVRYRPTSAAEAVKLLTLAGRDPTRSKIQPGLEIDDVDFRTIVHNCSAVLSGRICECIRTN
jgi:hypothetical protein